MIGAKMLDTAHGDPVSATLALFGPRPVECGRYWYAVQYNTGEQSLARAGIHRLGFSTFHPLIRMSIRDRRLGKRIVTVPAFPGYLFAEWGREAIWQRVLSRPGVSGILRPIGDIRGAPLPVPCGYMASLISRSSEGGVIEDVSVAPVQPALKPGALVRLTEGPFEGHLGLCQMSTSQRVTVLLNVMGCERNVDAKRRYVEAV
jgi:transcription antitermination factor NusG